MKKFQATESQNAKCGTPNGESHIPHSTFAVLMRAALIVALLAMSAAMGCASGDDDDNDSGPPADDTADDAGDDAADDTGDDSGDDTQPDDDTDDDDDTQPPQALGIVFSFPPVAPSGESYEFQFTAAGGEPWYVGWTIVAGAIPDGLTLDPDTGLLSGVVPDEEKLYYFVVEVTDSARPSATAQESFGIRVGNPDEDGPLLQKARAYQAVYDARHNVEGLTVTADHPDDPDGNYWYSDLGDACFIHGNSSAGSAYRYAVEQSPEALADAQLHAQGIHMLSHVTGIDGLLTRSYIRQDAPYNPSQFQHFWPDSEDHVGEGDYADYYWVGDVSIDQYSGALVGLSLLYDMVEDDSVRDVVRQDVIEIADYMWQGGMIIYDVDGEPTRYGDFRPTMLEGYPVPNGLAAAAGLAWFKVAYRVSGEQRFLDHYNELLSTYHSDWILAHFLWVYLGYETKHYNVYMAFENMFTLTRLEDDPALKQVYADSFKAELWDSLGDSLAWRRAAVEANPTYTTWYLQSTGRRDPEAVMKSIWQLDVFSDAPLRDRYIENSLNPDIVKNPEKPDQALYPLPSNLRVPDMCIWHRTPYSLDGGSDNGRERSGHDYLLPYWMGRYYGWISPDW
jgi:hypothetical protein